MDIVILSHGQVTRTTSELTTPLLTTPPHQQEDTVRETDERDNEHSDFVKESLGCAATPTAKDAMNDTALKAKGITKCFKMSVEECGISVDGRDTWTFIAKCGFYRNFMY
ncbi:hypothetical protein TNCV_4466031 [Trichonephila clavipes]|nr:hypothetical protein TNCV_4466031 [Trichonephila clavipes]